ncbi:MAG: hypothetical protein AB4290_02130 [Spirulina sp.]
MKILVSSAFQREAEYVGRSPSVFPQNTKLDSIIEYDTSGQPVEFRVDETGTSGYKNGVKVSIPERFSIIKSSSQLRFVLEAHDLITSQAGDVDFRVRPLASGDSGAGATLVEANLGVMFDCAGAGCAGVGCVTVGCVTAGKGGGGCGAAGCAEAGCAAAGCGAVGCAGAACAAAGKNTGGCGAAGCAAVGCVAAGCGAAACAAVGCLAAGCATVACGAATGECGAAACALDAFCAANAGWPP